MKAALFDKVIQLFFEALIAKVFTHYKWVVPQKLWTSVSIVLGPTVKKRVTFSYDF